MLPLINKTTQSYGRSIMKASDIVDFAHANKIPVAAITDHHSLSSVPEFLLDCTQKGIHGIAGVTLQITKNKRPFAEMVLLGKGGKGFASLRNLIDIAGHVGLDSKYNPERGLDLNDVLSGKYKHLFENCLALDGFPGSIGSALLKMSGGQEEPLEVQALYNNPENPLSVLKSQFDDGDYLGVQTPIEYSPIAAAMGPQSNGRGGVNGSPGSLESLVSVAKDAGQLRVSCKWFQDYAEEYLGSVIPDGKVVERVKGRFEGMHLRSAGETYKPSEPPYLGSDYLAKRCPIPKVFSATPQSHLLKGGAEARSLKEIINQKWPAFTKGMSPEEKKMHTERVRHELSVIEYTNFENYFVNIYKIQQMCEELDNPFMLRGSAVASDVLHVMGMTTINPLEHGLLFERFMNKDRMEDPDVDIEFMNAPQVSRSMNEYFEPGQIAMISSDNGIAKTTTLLEKAHRCLTDYYDIDPARKEKAGQAMNSLMYALNDKRNAKKPFHRIDKWLTEVWDKWPENKKTPAMKKIVELAKDFSQGVLGSNVSPGSAVFIPQGAGRSFNLLPSSKDKGIQGAVGRINQSKSNLVATGHIKYDILPNLSFTRSINVGRMVGISDYAPINLDDRSVARVFEQEAFLGVNQLNQFVGDKLAREVRPKNFAELTSLNALIRDGGSEELKEVIQQYIYAKNNPETVQLPEPLEPILRETHGSLLYEEQLLKILTNIGGFSFADADKFRSALKKGKGHVIDDYEGPFIKHVQEAFGVNAQTASDWYEPVRAKRGRYVFNKAHAVAYAQVGVRQCWLKANYPATYAADIFLHTPAQFKNKSISLTQALDDWKRLHGDKSPRQNTAADFIKASVSILRREASNPDSRYKRNPGWAKAEIEQKIKDGGFDFAIPKGRTRDELLNYSGNMFQRLEPYEIVRHDMERNQVASASPGAKAKKSGGTSNDSAPGKTSAEVANSKEPPANKRKGFIGWEDKVLIGHAVEFLQSEGIVKGLDISTVDSSNKDHYRFSVTDKQGNNHEYHVVGVSTDPVRAATHDSKFKLTSGFHQGGSRDREATSSLTLIGEIANLTGFANLPEAPLDKMKSGKGVRIKSRTKEGKAFVSALSKFARQSKNPLYDTESSGIGSARTVPAEPTSPIAINPNVALATHPKLKDLFEKSRRVSVDGMAEQLRGGHFTIGVVHNDKPFSGGERKPFTEVIANYRKVEEGVPLYGQRLMDGRRHASGGHQRFFIDKNKGRTTKMDLGFTTRRIIGHVCGDVKAGAETFWMGEAVLDYLSFNELQGELEGLARRTGESIPFAEKNSVAIRCAGGAEAVITKMLGVQIQGSGSTQDFSLIERNESIVPIDDIGKKSIADWLRARTIHWLDEPTNENTAAKRQINALMQEVGMSATEIQTCIQVHPYDAKTPYHENVKRVYKEMSGEGHSFLSDANIKTWLRGSNIAVARSEDGQWEVGTAKEEVKSISAPFSRMPAEEQARVKTMLQDRFVDLSGARSVGLALDNDGAGKKDADVVRTLCNQIGIPVGELMPDEIKNAPITMNGQQQTRDLKDHNDYLMLYREFHDNNQGQDADTLLRQYASFLKKPEKLLEPRQDVDRKLAAGR